MAIYLLVPTGLNAARLTEAVQAHTSEPDRYQIVNDAGWFVVYKGTSVELSNLLEITGQAAGQPSVVGSVLIIPVFSYYGRGNTDMWEWLKTRLEAG